MLFLLEKEGLKENAEMIKIINLFDGGVLIIDVK